MARKTNKTAHVLSLLAGDSDAKQEEQPASNSEKKPSNISLIDPSESADLSSLIRDSLDKEISGEDQTVLETEQNGTPSAAERITSAESLNHEDDLLSKTVSAALADIEPSQEERTDTQKKSFTDSETLNNDLGNVQPASENSINSLVSPVSEEISRPVIEPDEKVIPPDSEPQEIESESSESQTELQKPERLKTSSEKDEPEEEQKKIQTDEEVEKPEPEKTYIYLDVMKEVVEDRLMEYMNRFDVCTCERCVLDVKALTLSNLSPKFIVVEKNTSRPLLSFYKSKYSAELMTELTKACLAVLDHPRH